MIGHHLLHALILAAGDGDHGETVDHEGKTLHRPEAPKKKAYRSIFGVFSVVRYVYASGQKKAAEWLPVDAKLGLPAGEQSYVLEDWTQRVCAKESFVEGVGSLRDLLGMKTSVRAAEVMTRNMAKHAEGFSETKAAPVPGTDEELIVLAADGKGVPLARPLEERLKEHQAARPDESSPQDSPAVDKNPTEPKSQRLKRGEKRTRKPRSIMKYDEYLAKGSPIGTGVVEGACRHFVKDRMQWVGMRWEIEGAQAMLSLRALYVSDP